MSDWIYIVGETEFDQDFLVINQQTNKVVDISTATAEMFISNSAFTEYYGTGGPSPTPVATAMTIVANAQNISVARLNVLENQMPTSEGVYMAQIKLQLTPTIFKTYIVNLRVIRSLTD